MPFAPLAKGSDIDVFDTRVAVVFFGQGLRKLLRCPDIDGIVPDGSIRMVFCPAQVNLDFLRAHLVDKRRSPVVILLGREVALDKGWRVRQHAQGVSHIVLGKCVQQFFQFRPVVNALSRVQLVPLLVTGTVRDQVPRPVVQGTVGAVFEFRNKSPRPTRRHRKALVRVRKRAIKRLERVGDFGGVRECRRTGVTAVRGCHSGP